MCSVPPCDAAAPGARGRTAPSAARAVRRVERLRTSTRRAAPRKIATMNSTPAATTGARKTSRRCPPRSLRNVKQRVCHSEQLERAERVERAAPDNSPQQLRCVSLSCGHNGSCTAAFAAEASRLSCARPGQDGGHVQVWQHPAALALRATDAHATAAAAAALRCLAVAPLAAARPAPPPSPPSRSRHVTQGAKFCFHMCRKVPRSKT